MLAKPLDAKFMTQVPEANQAFVRSGAGVFAGNLASVEEALYKPKDFGRRIWELDNMLQSLFGGIFLEILAIEFGAITEEVLLEAKRLLIGPYQDDDEDRMRLA